MDFRAYLRNERLFTEDPYDQPNLLPKECVVTVPNEVIFDNFYRSEKQKIYCHICGGHRHLSGITGIIQGEKRILFGSSCARDFFGPEVTRLCASDLKRRTKRAHDRFTILEISDSIDPVENWLKNYRHLLNHIDLAWADIFLKHESAVTDILAHLRRNNGRLVETMHITVGGHAKEQQRFEQQSILGHISNPEAIPYLKQAGQRVTLVDAFVYAIKSVKNEPSDQMFSNLASGYQKTLDAAKIVDSVIGFTNDFFQPTNLDLIADWIENQRKMRLVDVREKTTRNLAPKLRKIMGSGVERPQISLSDAMGATTIIDKLQQRAGKPELQKISTSSF